MGEFSFTLICFGYGGEGAKSGGGFAGANGGGVVVVRGNVLGVAELATSNYKMDLEGVKGTPGAQWGGNFAWTEVRNVVQIHLSNIGWGD